MRFSIIIPCYNVAAFLPETLESVLAQTFSDWECICVDDGSTDDTAAILDGYAARDHRFRVVHKTNAGVSEARNDAIMMARGDYVCFLDGDDIWSRNWLDKVDGATGDGKTDIVRMSFTFWKDNEGDPLPVCSVESTAEVIEGADQIFSWGWRTYTTDGYIWLNTVRRSLLIDNGITFPVGMKINEDIIFDLTILPHAKRIVQSSYAGYYYRMRSTSAWHSKRPIEGCTRYLEESIKLWSECSPMLERLECLPQLRRNEAFMFFCSVLQWFEFGLKEDRFRANEIANLLRRANRLGMMDMRAIPIYWRPAFRWAEMTGDFSLARLTYVLLDIYHYMHRKIIFTAAH